MIKLIQKSEVKMQEERKTEFIWSLLEGGFLAIISMIWYKLTLFRCWAGKTYSESQMILWGIVVVTVFLGAWITCCSKNGWSVIKTLLIAYGSYTVLAYGETIGTRIKIILGISTIVAFLYVMLVMFRKIQTKRNKGKVIMKRLYKCMYAYLSVIAVGMGILLFSLACPLVIGNSLFQSSVEPTNADTSREQTIANNMDMLLFLQEEKWTSLNVEQKLDVMQTVANIESYYLGLPNELNVSAVNHESGILGSYADGTHTIYISLEHLEKDSAHDILNTCLHEAYHSFSHRLVDAYNSTDEDLKNLRIYKKAVSYLKEFNNYISGTQNFYAYHEQLCETDARKYAKDAVEDYYNRIYDYLGIEVSDSTPVGKTESCRISYDENGNAYLLDKNNIVIAGPYQLIEDDFQYGDNKITRYIGANGLYGYLNQEGKLITEPVFQKASIFQDGTAMVSMNGKMIYYIDTLGKRITKDYSEGYPFEHQGSYARVKSEDGTWGIINRQDKMVFKGADYIKELPTVTTVGSAIVNGNAVLFSLDLGAMREITVIKTYEDFCDISVHLGEFGIITNEHGLQGVVQWNGDILVPAEYEEITYELIQDNVLLKLQKSDGSYEVMYLY